jgi:mRNA-degrading endonuclease toxin of MazEF toxin-antitoxin module
MDVKQGEIYWVNAKDLDIQGSEQQKSRPYIIVSRTLINKLGKNVVGVPLSTKLHKASSHRLLIPVAHMVKDASCTRVLSDSVALTDHIRVLDIDRLEIRMKSKFQLECKKLQKPMYSKTSVMISVERVLGAGSR